MKVIFLFLILTGAHVTYCQSENEVHFESNSDSLKKYQDSKIFSTNRPVDTILIDYIQLDYSAFKTKYLLSHEEMVQISSAAELTYQLARADLKFDQINKDHESLLKEIESKGPAVVQEFKPHEYSDSLKNSLDTVKIEIRSYETDTIGK
nr:hypothetical protein [uncultured Brumimicrobium sp.]